MEAANRSWYFKKNKYSMKFVLGYHLDNILPVAATIIVAI